METEKEKKRRTLLQNKALHKYCEMVATLCKEHGITMRMLLVHYEVYPTPESIKAILREVGRMKFDKISTAEWNTDELQEVFTEHHQELLHITNGLIDIPFPSVTNTIEYLETYYE